MKSISKFIAWFNRAMAYCAVHRTLSCGLLLLPTLCLFVWLMRDGYPFLNRHNDAHFYIDAIGGYQQHGLYYHQNYLGYRSYLFMYFYSLFPIDFTKQLTIGGVGLSVFSLLSTMLFLATEFAALRLLWKLPLFWAFYVAVFLNPLILAYVPYPLQESFMVLLMALFVPLIYSAYVKDRVVMLVAGLGLFFGSMYMTRASEILLIFPAIGFLLYIIYAKAGNRVLLVSLFLLTSMLFIVPQSLVSMKYFSTLNPYPKTDFLASQFVWGDAYAKYATNISGSDKVGVGQPYWNPLSCATTVPNDFKMLWKEKSFDCSLGRSAQVKSLSDALGKNSLQELVFKAALHVFAALNYDYLKVYITDKSPPLFSWHQILSMLIVYCGFYLALTKWLAKSSSVFDLFLDGIMIVTIGTCLFFAVETRFGLLATIVLSLKAAELIAYHRPRGNELVSFVYGGVLFVGATSLLSIYMLSYSGALSR